MRESSLSHPGFVLSNKICSGPAALACSIDSHQPRTQAVQSAQNLNLVQSGKHTTTQFKHSLSAGSAHHHSLKTVNSHSIHSHGLNNPAIVRNSHSLTYMPLSKHSAPRTLGQTPLWPVPCSCSGHCRCPHWPPAADNMPAEAAHCSRCRRHTVPASKMRNMPASCWHRLSLPLQRLAQEPHMAPTSSYRPPHRSSTEQCWAQTLPALGPGP